MTPESGRPVELSEYARCDAVGLRDLIKAGVPFLIKDSGPMAAGMPFCCGSRSLQGVGVSADSRLVLRAGRPEAEPRPDAVRTRHRRADVRDGL
jgi:hypothetical protein